MSDLRFGYADDHRYSQYWRVAASAARPEIVIAGNRVGRFMHLTRHENSAFSHVRITTPDGPVELPWNPDEILPGVRRLVRLLIPSESIRRARPRGAGRVLWQPAPTGAEEWGEFTVLLCERGRPEIRNAEIIGAVELVDGSEALVFTRMMAGVASSATFVAPDPERVRALAREPDTVGLIQGRHPDGSLWFLELFTSPRDHQ